jgi:multidrug efflux pump subunit AcrB
MEKQLIIPAPTYDELQAQLKELQQERAKLTTDLQAANGETNKTKYALLFAQKDQQDANKKAENLAVLLGSQISEFKPQQISEFKPQQITEFEKNRQNAETQLMLWATDASEPNEKRLTQALYITYLMRAANKDIQMQAFAQAKEEAKRLISNDLPPMTKE